jgi:REase_AHJR-like
MNTARHQASQEELDLLASLRRQYEAKGFSFEIEPFPQRLPDFLGSYVPDAIARKAGENVAIEVRKSRTRASEFSLQQIRSRLDGHPDWTFAVAYAAEDPLKTLTIKPAAVPAIRRQLADVRALMAQGQSRAAFLLAWSLLEATLLNVEGEHEARPRTPASVLQGLAMLGRIEPETERRLRSAILLRNAVVHGDLTIEPTIQDVGSLALVIDEALTEG